MNLNRLVQRAVLWHEGRLPRSEALPYYDFHIAGPNPTASTVIRFHTYACLFPELGRYLALNTHEWPDCSISPIEMRNIIAAAAAPQKKIAEQRKLIVAHIGPSSPRLHWMTAVSMAQASQLPTGFYAVGDTLEGERIVYLRAVLTAPLDLLIAEFKKAAPRINFN